MTGRALEHAHKVLFARENGNRVEAVDVMLVITDGRAQDPLLASDVAKKLRKEGVIVSYCYCFFFGITITLNACKFCRKYRFVFIMT